MAKISASGELVWASYLGASGGSDQGFGIAVDASGSCYVTGFTASRDFPAPAGFDKRHNGGDWDVFVAKVTASGKLHGQATSGAAATTTHGALRPTLREAAISRATRTPLTSRPPAAFRASYGGGDRDAFVAKVTSSGRLAWASYLGGSANDLAYGIAADASGNCTSLGKRAHRTSRRPEVSIRRTTAATGTLLSRRSRRWDNWHGELPRGQRQ